MAPMSRSEPRRQRLTGGSIPGLCLQSPRADRLAGAPAGEGSDGSTTHPAAGSRNPQAIARWSRQTPRSLKEQPAAWTRSEFV